MSYSLTWIPDVLGAADLKVACVDGFAQRGRGDMGTPRGVMCHHTAGRPRMNMPSLKRLVEGRHDLPGPLANLGLGRDGTYYVIAAGKANHAGTGIWNGITRGNGSFIGIEAEHIGDKREPWPEVQIDAYRRGVAALLAHLRLREHACIGHKEFALPRGRKSDPCFDMQRFRSDVAALLDGNSPKPTLIPAAEKPSPGSTHPRRPTLRRGNDGGLVAALQRVLHVHGGGGFDGITEAAVRAFQRRAELVPDGIVGPKTWRALDGLDVLADVSAEPAQAHTAIPTSSQEAVNSAETNGRKTNERSS